MTNDRLESLFFLKNQAVVAIVFMHGYLQVELSNATLTCYPGPIVLGAASDFTTTHAEYKNQLCQLINQSIKEVTEIEKGLVITFKEHELLFEPDGPREILVVTDGNGEWHSYPDLLLNGTD